MAPRIGLLAVVVALVVCVVSGTQAPSQQPVTTSASTQAPSQQPVTTTAPTEFRLNKAKLTWSEHEAEAIRWGGHMASIINSREQQLVLQLIKGVDFGSSTSLSNHTIHFDGPFIGAVRQDGNDRGPGPEYWRWIDGQSWNYTHWYTGQPNDKRGKNNYREDTAKLEISDGPMRARWIDITGCYKSAAIYKRGGKAIDYQYEPFTSDARCESAAHNAAPRLVVALVVSMALVLLLAF